MNDRNLALARFALAGLSKDEREVFIRELTNAPAPREPEKLLKPRDAAARLGVTPRTVFNLIKSGALGRVILPGRTRGAGVRESELNRLITGGSRGVQTH